MGRGGGIRDQELLSSSEARHREETETNRPEERKDKNSNGWEELWRFSVNAKCHLCISDVRVCPSLLLSVWMCLGGLMKVRRTGTKDARWVFFVSLRFSFLWMDDQQHNPDSQTSQAAKIFQFCFFYFNFLNAASHTILSDIMSTLIIWDWPENTWSKEPDRSTWPGQNLLRHPNTQCSKKQKSKKKKSSLSKY